MSREGLGSRPFALSLLAGPLAAEARQAAIPAIGCLGSASPDLFASRLRAFINVRTAKALGLTIPPSVLARADEVIQ